MSGAATSPPLQAAAIWHDAECGGYHTDLPCWERRAAESPGFVLDLGAGTGRVSLHLAARGHRVLAVDSDAELLDALRERASRRALEVETAVADVRELELGGDFDLILAPMQLVHLLGGASGRARAFSALARHLAPGALLAIAVLREPLPPSGRPEPLPDVREIDGWIHSSMPLDVRVGEETVELDRLRQLVSPDGVLTETLQTTCLDRLRPPTLERELREAGLAVLGSEAIDETAEHVGSLLVTIGAVDG